MSRTSALAAVAALFLAGVLVGGLAVHLYHGSTVPAPAPPPERGRGPGPWELVSARFIERLDAELDLTPEQRAEIERLMAQGRRELEDLRRELRPRVEQSIRLTRERIRGVLTPEQARVFDELGPLAGPRGPRRGRGRHPAR